MPLDKLGTLFGRTNAMLRCEVAEEWPLRVIVVDKQIKTIPLTTKFTRWLETEVVHDKVDEAGEAKP